jgi:hypothetical protein
MSAKALLKDSVVKAEVQGTRATAAVDLTYANRSASHAEPVAILANQLLRDLGYATDLRELQRLMSVR